MTDVASNSSLPQSPTDRNDFTRALIQAFPLAVSVFTYGLAYGALAHSTNHLNLLQTLAMSVLVFAGASQFTILALFSQGAALFVILGSVFLLNARQILYGLSLGPHMRGISKKVLPFLAHGLTDESYSVSIAAAKSDSISAPFFLGAGSAVFVPWLISSAVGFALGGLIANPQKFGLDFAYTAAFMGLLGAQITSVRRAATALISGISAIVAGNFAGTSGAVLAGALVSFLIGYFGNEKSSEKGEGAE